MADAPVFDSVCRHLEARTSLDHLETRGTVRLALKVAGLDARSVSPEHMKVVLEKVMPSELAARGIEDSEDICRELVSKVDRLASDPDAPDSPDAVFARLGGK